MTKTFKNKMGVMPVGKLIIDMGLPIMIALAVHALYNIVDGIYVSRIGLDALNAVSLALPVQRLISSMAIGCAIGINALLSKALGENDHGFASRIAGNGLLIALIVSVFFVFFGLFALEPLIAAQTENPLISKYAVQYLRIVCCFSFTGTFEVTLERLLTSTGRTSLTMISQIFGTVLNVVMDPIFIFTLDMGVAGAAIATVLSQFFAMLLVMYMQIRKNREITLSPAACKPDKRILIGICAIAIPSIITNLAASFMTFGMNILLYRYTQGQTVSQNVFGIYSKLNSLVFLPIMGIGNGVIPIVAFNLGARNEGRVRETVYKSTLLNVVISLVITAVFCLIPKQLIGVFMGGATQQEADALYAVGLPALRIISLSFVFAAVTMTLCSVFQGMGNGACSMIPSIARQVVLLLPAAYVLAKTGMRSGTDIPVWFSCLIAEGLSMLLALFLMKKQYAKLKRPLEK